MQRIARAAAIWAISILIPVAVGVVCGVALDPLQGAPLTSAQRTGLGICGLAGIAAGITVVAVFAAEAAVLAITALLDWIVAPHLPRDSRGFAFYRAVVGIAAGLLGGGLVGLPLGQVILGLPAVAIGPLVGLLLNLPVGTRAGVALRSRLQGWRLGGEWSAWDLVRWARRAWRVWLAGVALSSLVGTVVAAVRAVTGAVGEGIASLLLAVGLAYATAGYLAAVGGTSALAALLVSSVAALVVGWAARQRAWDADRAQAYRWLGGGLGGALGAGLAAWAIGIQPAWALALLALLGALVGLGLQWRRWT